MSLSLELNMYSNGLDKKKGHVTKMKYIPSYIFTLPSQFVVQARLATENIEQWF